MPANAGIQYAAVSLTREDRCYWITRLRGDDSVGFGW